MSEVFSGRKGRFVSLADTITGFGCIKIYLELLEGEGDEYPEAAFYMMGTIEEAIEEGKKLANFGKWYIIFIK